MTRDYLSGPRIHFFGRFISDPSTINNSDAGIDSYQLASILSPSAFKEAITGRRGGWNPEGTGAWSLRGCKVVNVTYRDGSSFNTDPAINEMAIAPGERATDGKLVDLDPDEQWATQIWGFKIRLVDSNRSTIFVGDFRPAAFQDIWRRVVPEAGRGGNPYYGAFYHSIVENIQWSSANFTSSQAISELREETASNHKLSIRFTLDGYVADNTRPDFTTGRIVGVMGPYNENTPYSFILGRSLIQSSRSNFDRPKINRCYANIHGKHLSIDLSNSLQTVEPGGKLADIGSLYLALIPKEGSPFVFDTEIPYRQLDWYENSGGIFTITLENDAQIELAKNSSIGLVDSTGNIIISESREQGLEGLAIRAVNNVYRLNPDDAENDTKVKLIVTRFGHLASDITVRVKLDPSNISQGLMIKKIEEEKEEKEIECTTDANGIAEFELIAHEPYTVQRWGNEKPPRKYIDGQIFKVIYSVVVDGKELSYKTLNGLHPLPTDKINVLIWNKYEIPKTPTWNDHVESIFKQYANLYPVMKRIIDLSNYESVTSHLASLKAAFSEETTINSPHYMPVTRDMSKNKRAMIRKWLDNPLYKLPSKNYEEQITTIGQLREALQDAISLELATIPPYLCALYSIKPKKNQEAALVLRAIVMEEMLHVALVCNILNAIGGEPILDQPQYIPNYPGTLPHGIQGDLKITLGPLTKDRIKKLFMPIEMPMEEGVILPPDASVKEIRISPPTETDIFTIGDFYTGIKFALKRLNALHGERLFTSDLSRQLLVWPQTHDNISVTNLETALQAIDKIITQGEGTSKSLPTSEAESLSHYYRFLELLEGKKIRPSYQPDGMYVYQFTNENIVLDEAGIYPMKEQVEPLSLPDGSYEQIILDEFNEMYARLLKALNLTFNGKPEELGNSIGIMRNLQIRAEKLMEVKHPEDSSYTLGPTFNCHAYLVQSQEVNNLATQANQPKLFKGDAIRMFFKSEPTVKAKPTVASSSQQGEKAASDFNEDHSSLIGHKFK